MNRKTRIKINKFVLAIIFISIVIFIIIGLQFPGEAYRLVNPKLSLMPPDKTRLQGSFALFHGKQETGSQNPALTNNKSVGKITGNFGIDWNKKAYHTGGVRMGFFGNYKVDSSNPRKIKMEHLGYDSLQYSTDSVNYKYQGEIRTLISGFKGLEVRYPLKGNVLQYPKFDASKVDSKLHPRSDRISEFNTRIEQLKQGEFEGIDSLSPSGGVPKADRRPVVVVYWNNELFHPAQVLPLVDESDIFVWIVEDSIICDFATTFVLQLDKANPRKNYGGKILIVSPLTRKYSFDKEVFNYIKFSHPHQIIVPGPAYFSLYNYHEGKDKPGIQTVTRNFMRPYLAALKKGGEINISCLHAKYQGTSDIYLPGFNIVENILTGFNDYPMEFHVELNDFREDLPDLNAMEAKGIHINHGNRNPDKPPNGNLIRIIR